MLTNVKLVQPTVLIMRTVQTQRAHIIVVVKLDLQEMEPIAPVRRVTEHPLFTVFKKQGHDRKRRTLFFWSKFTDCSVSYLVSVPYSFKVHLELLRWQFLQLLVTFRWWSKAKSTGDKFRLDTHRNSDVIFSYVFCSLIHYLPQTLTSVQLNRPNVTSMPSVWTYRVLFTALVKPVLPEMEQYAQVCRMKQLVRPVIKTINYVAFTKKNALSWN